MTLVSDDVEGAVRRASDFLVGSEKGGLWHDFTLAPGWSDEWVTGYVVTRLHPVVGQQPMFDEAWQLLQARAIRRGGGWGYNAIVPQDADSTSWVLRLAAAINASDSDVAQQARLSLVEFRHSNGMLGTYGPTDAIRRFIGASAERSFVGWTSPHACVTAAAAAIDGVVDPTVLPREQQPDGRWSSYWWEADSFATALAVESCADESARHRAAAWALEMLTSPEERNSFDLANLIATASLGGQSEDQATIAALQMLLAAQRPDGGWDGQARMRVPDPGDPNPDARRDWLEGGRIEGAVVRDSRGMHTTATALHALHSWRLGLA